MRNDALNSFENVGYSNEELSKWRLESHATFDVHLERVDNKIGRNMTADIS